MSRPRTPTALLELRGSFKHDPQRNRVRQNEPLVTTPLPEPPAYLTAETTAAWSEMKSWGYWLTSADKFLVEIAATLMARYRINTMPEASDRRLVASSWDLYRAGYPT